MSKIIKIRDKLLDIGFSHKIDFSNYRSKHIFKYKKHTFEVTEWAIDYEDLKYGFRSQALLSNEEAIEKMYNFILEKFCKELRKIKIKKLLNDND